MNDEVYFWHADKHLSLLQVDTIIFECVQPGMPKVPKIRSLHIFAISPEKHGGEVDFLPANKHEISLLVDSITLGLRSQPCPKHLKQYFNKELSDEIDFSHEDKYESLLQIDSMILMGMVKIYQSSQLASLQCLYNVSKKKLKMKLIFCMQINIKVS